MASYSKRGKVWVASVFRTGVRKSKSFDTKAQAVAWATKFEADIIASKNGRIPNKSFSELLFRYAEEISTKKRGERWERIRIEKIAKMPIGDVRLPDLRSADFAEWREARLKAVSASSVHREMAIMSNACTVAMREWNWLQSNPMANVSRPKLPDHRDRRISDDEITRILYAVGYEYNRPPVTSTARVGAAFLFAIETAMRAGEIVKLTWDKVDIDRRVASLTETKNGTNRNVPLSTEAIRILCQLPREVESAFNLTSASMDTLFRKAKSRAMIDDLHFHDTRHEAITRLARKLDVLDLARMVGHRDLKQLMVYYNATAEELAKRLD